uniref:Reverse transcriptase domain-containing protein n=1 Tax=Erpetoichthys calabaricus TaxID=27687 RepID=A0A8C4T6I6_ERPCA
MAQYLIAAFDTIDQSILLHRLENDVGLTGTVLAWSYFCNRTLRVMLDDFSSESVPLPCGVPQGSILGPLLFSIYILPLGAIFRKHAISYHLYADDCQIYFSLKSTDSTKPLLNCLSDIKDWLAVNFLHLNDSKTEVIVFSPDRKQTLPLGLDFLPIPVTSSLKTSLSPKHIVFQIFVYATKPNILKVMVIEGQSLSW